MLTYSTLRKLRVPLCVELWTVTLLVGGGATKSALQEKNKN